MQFAEILKRLDQIEQRLTNIERALNPTSLFTCPPPSFKPPKPHVIKHKPYEWKPNEPELPFPYYGQWYVDELRAKGQLPTVPPPAKPDLTLPKSAPQVPAKFIPQVSVKSTPRKLPSPPPFPRHLLDQSLSFKGDKPTMESKSFSHLPSGALPLPPSTAPPFFSDQV